jgi:hypothetical protein
VWIVEHFLNETIGHLVVTEHFNFLTFLPVLLNSQHLIFVQECLIGILEHFLKVTEVQVSFAAHLHEIANFLVELIP